MLNPSIPPETHTARRALVLGGGGPVGRAWEWGLAAGCLDAGLDWRQAERIIGTSAGAMVGAQLGLGLDATQSRPVLDGSSAAPSVPSAFGQLALLLARAGRAPDPQSVWRDIGRFAVDTATQSEDDSLARASFSLVRDRAFPASLWATSVGAREGQLKVWRAADAVPLLRAVAASAALPGVWPPITIGAQRYMDGGVRSMLNADLAAGSRRVIIVSCFDLSTSGVTAAIRSRNEALNAEIDLLRRSGSTLEVVTPDADLLALTAHGTKMLDGQLAPEAYDLGCRQALREADRLRTVWAEG